MKVRIGVSLGQAGVPDQFSAAVDTLEAAGVDSLWLPEMVYGSLVDPFIGMAHALAWTSQLKVGTGVAVLPGRHPVLVAKQLATLAGLAPRRVLPVFGLKPARPAEQFAFPVPRLSKSAVFDDWKHLGLEADAAALLLARVDTQGDSGAAESDGLAAAMTGAGALWVAQSTDDAEAEALFEA